MQCHIEAIPPLGTWLAWRWDQGDVPSTRGEAPRSVYVKSLRPIRGAQNRAALTDASASGEAPSSKESFLLTCPRHVERSRRNFTLIPEIDEFKGCWAIIATLSLEKWTTLRCIATIESVGSCTRIEGSNLGNAKEEKLFSGRETKSFGSRDEGKVADFADAMDMMFNGVRGYLFDRDLNRALHSVILKHNSKGQDHRCNYKTVTNTSRRTD